MRYYLSVCLCGALDSQASKPAANRSGVNTVRASTTPVWETSEFWCEERWPLKWLWGLGGFHQNRDPQVSFEAAADYYLRLSSRQFQDPIVVLVLYDVIARQRLFQSVTASVRASQNFDQKESSDGAGGSYSFGEMSTSELKAAAQYHEQCMRARSKGLPDPELPKNMRPAVVSAIRSLSAHAGACEHSGENARRARVRMHGYNMRLGCASWWLTISADDNGSVLVWHLSDTGGERPIRIPLSAARSQRVSDNPVAAALAFERQLKLVLRCVVGWEKGPLKRVCLGQSEDASQAGGLLGVCKGFVYAIETQGRGSLHAHILVWGEIPLAERLRSLGVAAVDAVHSCSNGPQPTPATPVSIQLTPSQVPASGACLTDEQKSQMRQQPEVVNAMACLSHLMDRTITRELCLPNDIHTRARSCSEPDCKGTYELQNANDTLH